MTTIGYARVSTDGQTLAGQQAALQSAGCECVFSEKQSGAKTDRQQLAKAIAALTAGDTLVVCKLDRLARSTRDLLNTLAAVADAGATFKIEVAPPCFRDGQRLWLVHLDPPPFVPADVSKVHYRCKC